MAKGALVGDGARILDDGYYNFEEVLLHALIVLLITSIGPS